VEREPVELPFGRDGAFDPAAGLTALRARSPLTRLAYTHGPPGWLVTSHALARQVLTDPRFGVNTGAAVGSPAGPYDPDAVAAQAPLDRLEYIDSPEAQGIMLVRNPPQHTRLRLAHASYFSVRRSHDHRERIERIVEELLDELERVGPPVDLLTTYTRPFASFVTCELIGVPRSERHKFEEAAAAILKPGATAEEAGTRFSAEYDHAHEVVRRKRAQPGDDWLSELAATSDLSDAELTGATVLMFRAAHHTTATQLTLSVLALLSDRSRWEALRADPELIEGAVEELLRYLTIFQLGVERTAFEDLELDGTRVRAGERVWVSLAAANRDPDRFASPDVCDFSRDAGGHLGFGHGRHVCLGQHLARLELRLALEGLLGRFPTLRLAVPPDDVPAAVGEHFFASVRELPVAW
jgi:cytochrome P450